MSFGYMVWCLGYIRLVLGVIWHAWVCDSENSA